jgi:acetylornithine deacetylase/succinyl-diaminopimelate desuccinylase-like protein
VIAWERPIRITADTRPLVETFAREGLLPDASEGEALGAFAAANPKVRARLFDGISVTSFHAGYKHNVIPSHAEATLDIRLLPDTDRDAFLEALRTQLADDDISIEIVHTEDSPPSPTDTELARVCQEVVKEFIEDANFTASMCSGGTDSRYFRRRGIPAYGFNPILATEEEAASIHSHNERITLDNIRLGTRIVFEVVRRMCA